MKNNYSEKQDKVILHILERDKKDPSKKLSDSMEEASRVLGKTKSSIAGRYYGKLKDVLEGDSDIIETTAITLSNDIQSFPRVELGSISKSNIIESVIKEIPKEALIEFTVASMTNENKNKMLKRITSKLVEV